MTPWSKPIRCFRDLRYRGGNASSTRIPAMEKIAQLQVDNALLFESVNNALKLLGDQYMARVYTNAAKRFHLADWDASILRKLSTLESIYDKITERVASQRMELLEWIIIVLIALSIVVTLPGIAGK